MGDEIYAGVARDIAATLCRDAIRDGDRCNWLGDSMENLDGQLRKVHRSFGGDLYAGTSGVALFLASVDRVRPDPLFRRTARAAIRHALGDAASMSNALRLGFYTGATGAAYAAVRIGEAFDDDALIEEGLSLFESASVIDEQSPIDILSGAAGIIGPLLDLRTRHKHDWMLDRAKEAGELLLRRARRSDQGVSWSVLGDEWATADLTGYSHGASGFALALMHLARATGNDARYTEAADGALRYERSCYSPQQQNWPDFRRTSGAQSPAIGFSLGWCHGAPGIGLSRLHAYRLTQRQDIFEDAGAALRGTYTPLATLQPSAMFALCHGAAGNAELFIEAGEVLGDPGYTAIAEAIGRQGIERYHEPRRPWPSGLTAGGQTPGLMLGLAGIGYFYLRLHDHATPSLLTIVPRV
jgi:lantibiotic modifying enzyme